MAYLTLTDLNDIQARQATNFKRNRRFGQLDMVKDSTPAVDYVPPSIKDELSKMPSDMLGKIPVLKDQTVTVVTTPGFNYIPSNLAESDVFNFVPYDVFSGFRFYPASFESNQINAEFYKQNVMKNVLEAMAATIEGIVNTNLAARKTQVLGFTKQVSQGDGVYTFNAGTDTLEISKAAVKEALYYNVMNLMRANKLGGEYRLVTSPAGLVYPNMAAMQYGESNEKNIAWNNAIIPLDRRYESDLLVPGDDIFTGYMMRDGAMGIYENYPWDFRNNTSFAGKTWSISDVELPFTRMRANVYINNEATEATSLVSSSNMVMTHFEEMAIWHRFYIVYRYNQALATYANDIVKLEGKTV
jgi:hypothetical protein